MEESIKKLIDLQDCDARIMEIKDQKVEGPNRIKALEEKLLLLESEMEEEMERLDVCKKEGNDIELEIEDIDSKVEKSNSKLSNIRDNKEYRAALKEIETMSKEKGRFEDRTLEIMEQLEVLKKSCTSRKESLKKGKEAFKKDKSKIMKEIKALDLELEELEAKRSGLSEDIDANLLKSYDTIRKHKDGVAITSVIKGVCQACHMGIPPQKFNELIRGDSLMNCPNCMRIMYWGDNEKFKKTADVEGASE